MGKSILLIMPIHFELYNPFIKNLKRNGFEVEEIYLTDTPFRYKNIVQRGHNFIRKVFLRDRTYKLKLKKNRFNDGLSCLLAKRKNKVDYALVIRPDFFSKKVLLRLKESACHLFAYQWDGIDRFPNVKELIPVFESFYVFDVDDISKYSHEFDNLKQTTNFYFDFFPIDTPSKKEIFFLGSFIENRIHKIINIGEFLNKKGYQTNINIYYHQKEVPQKHPSPYINYTTKQSTYTKMMESVRNASVVLDFSNHVHNGLSFRTFEAIYFQKKLITNNPLVKKHDFYNGNNIFVFDDTNFEELDAFMEKPYMKLPDLIVEKYGFSNWIKYMLQIKPFIDLSYKF